MRHRIVWTTVALAALAAAASQRMLAAQPPLRMVDLVAKLDSHVVRHPKSKISTALVKRPSAGTKDSVATSARTTTPLPVTRPRPKAVR